MWNNVRWINLPYSLFMDSGAQRDLLSNWTPFKAASTRSVSDGSHSLNTAKYGHKAALFLSPALFHESLTSVG